MKSIQFNSIKNITLCSAFLIIGVLCLTSTSLAQGDGLPQTDCENRHWVKLKTIPLPPQRAYHAMAYDAESDRLILFSGDSGPGYLQMYSDT